MRNSSLCFLCTLTVLCLVLLSCDRAMAIDRPVTAPADPARPFVEEVWPSVVQRGRRNRLELRGRQIEQAVGLWASVPGVTLVARPETPGTGQVVVLDVDVPARAPLGLYGLRLATASGLSNVCLFLIDELDVRIVDVPGIPAARATEEPAAPAVSTFPGESSGAAAAPSALTEVVALQLPACVAARSRPAGVDRYSITVSAGQQLTFEIVGSRLGRDYDPLLTVRNSSGQVVARGDNSPGLFFDCRFAHRFATAGTYTVEVHDARFRGEAGWNHVLRIGDFPAARSVLPSLLPAGTPTGLHLPGLPGVRATATAPAAIALTSTKNVPAQFTGGWFFHELRYSPDRPATWVPLQHGSLPALFEQEPDNQAGQPSSASFPAAISGFFSGPGDEDWLEFELTRGDAIRVQGVSAEMGSAADLELVLYEPQKNGEYREARRNDETLVRNAELGTAFITEAGFTFNARYSGPHRLQVREMSGGGGPEFTWRVDVEHVAPRLTLTADVTRLSIPAGTYQPLPVTVKREGFQGDIHLSLIGAPAGLSLEPAIIPADETEVVCRLLAAPGMSPAIASLQVVGRATARVKEQEFSLASVAVTHPLVDRQFRNKDYTLLALRVEQRLLPPSLRNRIAVQVLSPAPFDITLPEPHVLMAKYLTAGFPIQVQRQPGFTSTVQFGITGGQIDDENEERVQVYGRIPPATSEDSQVTAQLFNRIRTSPATHRVDVFAMARHQQRWITLTRTFTLEVRPAFRPYFEVPQPEFLPGETRALRLIADRVAGFQGDIELQQTVFQPGITIPAEITIPAGQASVEVPVTVAADHVPGRRGLRYESTGTVGGYQERVLAPVVTIIVQRPPKPETEKK